MHVHQPVKVGALRWEDGDAPSLATSDLQQIPVMTPGHVHSINLPAELELRLIYGIVWMLTS